MMHLTCTNMPVEKLQEALAKVSVCGVVAWGGPQAA
jgi:5,10-methylenetetrahydrofolate reductase